MAELAYLPRAKPKGSACVAARRVEGSRDGGCHRRGAPAGHGRSTSEKIMRKGSIGAALAVAVVATALTPSVAGAEAIAIGQGRLPALAVDAAGTGYVSWWESEVDSSLFFCRFPRGAAACDAGAASSIPVHGDGLTPAPLVVSGPRVVAVANRNVNEASTLGPTGLFAYTSTNGGVSFGQGHVVGSVPIFDSVPGPGDTLSGVEENGKPLRFQNVPLDGSSPANPDGTSTVPYAALTTDEFGYNASVGLLDAGTPLVVYQHGVGGNDAAFRRYDGSGSVNDSANWTPQVSIGPLYGPKLAGGPGGLFLLGRDSQIFSSGNVVVRKFNGITFGPPVTIGPGGGIRAQDLFQDAAGRLHAVYERADASVIVVVHAVSDDGVIWRKVDLVTYPPTVGALINESAGVAPDHIGFAVAESATAPSAIGLSPLGPDAPGAGATPIPPSIPSPPAGTVRLTPSLDGEGIVKRRGKRFRIKVSGRLVLPDGVSETDGCQGTIKVTLLRVKKVLTRKTATVAESCAFRVTGSLKRSRVRKAKRLKLRLAFSGNPTLTPLKETESIRVRRN
jgi:hypothetical protein